MAMMMVSISPSLIFSRSCASERLAADIDILELRVAFERGHAEVSADAGLFESAEGSFDVDAGVGVDGEDAGFDAFCDAQGAVEIAGPERGAQAIGGIVHLLQHRLFII